MSWFSQVSKKLTLPTESEALPGRQTAILPQGPHAALGSSMLPPHPDGAEVTYFGMGCFWGAEKLFWAIPGVYTTAVGYGGGFTPNPTYEEVCSGKTGHNELVKVVFHPDKVSYQDLIRCFWENHNPCEGMRQGNDVGTQYRSGLYVVNEAQANTAAESQAVYNRQLAAHGLSLTTTEIIEQFDFYYAETYHQQYLAKNPGGYCPNHGCDATGLPRFKKDT